MIPLFAYGTLRSAAYQQALFDRTYPTRPATLPGWQVVVAESGYFTVRADPAGCAAGDLVELDARGLEIADAWEEVPVYERVHAQAHDAGGREVECWLYVRPTRSRAVPPAEATALHDPAAVLAAIAEFRSRETG